MGKQIKHLRTFTVLQILILVLAAMFLVFSSVSQSADEHVWYVKDTIDPSLEEVKWREEGVIDEAPPWIADGTWLDVYKRESLVGSKDIFVSMYERFNWSLVRDMYGFQFVTFNDFAQYLIDNPLWWLKEVWEIDTEWYGVSANTTGINHSYNAYDYEAQLWTYFHITRIPEYFVGSERLSNWLVGFDLTSISIGNLGVYEFYEDSNIKGVHYDLYFKAPANILTQHGDNFTLTIAVSPAYIGQTLKMQQVIDINMPANTEIKEMSPFNLSLPRGNTGTFVISKEDQYPMAFTVISGAPSKPLNQIVWETASVWLFTPGGWAAMVSVTVILYTAFRGRRIWGRSRLYHRMYNSMVTIYDLYSSDILKFHQEMANVSSSVFKLLIEDKITDEQFEKLLIRRDDLVKRVQGEPPRPQP